MLKRIKKDESEYKKKEEKIRSATITKELFFLDCNPNSLYASKAKEIPSEALDPKEMELAELKLGLHREEKGLTILTSQSIWMS